MLDNNANRKTCLVTGGASGLGKAIATKYLEAGASVVICDINEERLLQAFNELAVKGTLKAVKADITSAEEAQNLFNEIIHAFGKLDVLVNNAGIMDHFDPVGDLDEGLWDKVMAVNLKAPYLLSKLAVQHMLSQEKPDGCIFNIVSVAGKAGWAAGAAYTASKHGLLGLTKNTASFYGSRGIRCNSLVMGGMETNIADSFKTGMNTEGYQKTNELLKAVNIPLCDVDRAAELCTSLTFGKGTSLVNGACIPVDHGWSAVYGIS
ncbi:NAD dependent epimerase/dehydratase family [Aspergillus sclerotialis]|uniref:NAD dependent epimerase/dehydratase family n=1 Tax=Aspergillus sclerotialis TaxID=2070753 RepID=A0A3A2ZX25_9EURO|nr:NAD dependent epimerase/dehydratase family [Aspergillus sclerotialis]